MDTEKGPDTGKKEQPVSFRDWFKSLPKTIPKWSITMFFILISIGLVGLGLNLVGIKDVNIHNLGNVPYLTTTGKDAGIASAGLYVFIAAIVGGLVTFFLSLSRGIGIFFHIAKDYETGGELREEIKKKMKSLRIITAIITGVLSGGIILIGLVVFANFTGVDASDLSSWGQFVGLLRENHYVAFVLGIITLAATAFGLKFFNRRIEEFAKMIHDRVVPTKGHIDKVL